VGSAAAAVVLVVGVIVGVVLSGQHGRASDPPGPTTATGGTPSTAAGGDHTGTATLVGSLSPPGGNTMDNAFFSVNGNDIAAASGKADVYIFSAETLKLVKTLAVPAGDVAYPMSFSPDDKTLYDYDGTSGEMYVMDIATGKATNKYRLTGVSSAGYTLGGSVFGIATSGSTVDEYELATDKRYAQVTNPGKAPIAGGGITPDGDGKYVLISDTDGASYLVDAPSKAVVGTFRYTYSGKGTAYPQITLDGSTVYVPGGPSAPARLWDTRTRSYITPTDSHWPAVDDGVLFSTDSKFVLTSPTSASDVVDIWNIATRAHVITVTVPGGANEGTLGLGPGGSELLSTGPLDISSGTFTKLNIWAVPA
jgi:WD40 repeat protein